MEIWVFLGLVLVLWVFLPGAVWLGWAKPCVREQEPEPEPLYEVGEDYIVTPIESKLPAPPTKPRLSPEDNRELQLLKRGYAKHQQFLENRIQDGSPNIRELFANDTAAFKRKIAELEAKGTAW